MSSSRVRGAEAGGGQHEGNVPAFFIGKTDHLMPDSLPLEL